MAIRIGNRSRFSNGFGSARQGGKSRIQQHIDNNLGVVPGDRLGNDLYRNKKLEEFDSYLNNRQYDKLIDWDTANQSEDFVPIRRRKPRIIFNLGKLIVDRVTAKLVGDNVWPHFKVEDDPDTEDFFRVVLSACKLKAHAPHLTRKLLGSGSAFLRFFVLGPKIMIEVYNAKYCYPSFDDLDELTELEVRYVYTDNDDLDANGEPKKKWYRMLLSRDVDILFDNPDYVPGGKAPEFQEVARAEHGFGFVQGQWFRTTKDKHTPDGESLLCGILGFIDSINYSLSQTDQAISYGQEPQLAVKGMDTQEIDNLVKSSTRAWNLGRDGEAKFVEANMGGIEKAMELRERMQKSVGDIARVVMLDPEKIVGSAQSAKAMEVLHGPLVELVHELRPAMEEGFVAFLTKVAVAVLMLDRQGVNEAISMPKGFVPASMNLTASWPPVFPMTMVDLQQKVSVGVQAANASLISRETVTGWIAKDFGIEDVQEEVAKVAAQPQLNPFGAF